MKLGDFLQDELAVGKGSVKVPIKGLIEQYRERYDKMKTGTKKFSASTYTVSPGGRRIVHVKVPSETLDSFFYDVLLELDAPTDAKAITDCEVRIFSNCPSFVYGFAYVFYHLDITGEDTRGKKGKGNGLLINSLVRKVPRERLLMPGTEKKLGSEVLDNPPETRNRLGLPLFDKSIYYAIFYLQDEIPFRTIISTKNNITEAQLLRGVADFDTLMSLRKKQEKLERDRKRNERKLAEDSVKETERNVRKMNRNAVRISKPIAPTAAKSPKSANRSKSVRRIGEN